MLERRAVVAVGKALAHRDARRHVRHRVMAVIVGARTMRAVRGTVVRGRNGIMGTGVPGAGLVDARLVVGAWLDRMARGRFQRAGHCIGHGHEHHDCHQQHDEDAPDSVK